MLLEGVVSNVAAFGAFVDIGVHQDGLVHLSALSDRFVKDPREVVKAGDIIKVKVLEVDVARKRIALTRRLDDPVGAARDGERDARRDGSRGNDRGRSNSPPPRVQQQAAPFNSAMAEALKGLKRGGGCAVGPTLTTLLSSRRTPAVLYFCGSRISSTWFTHRISGSRRSQG